MGCGQMKAMGTVPVVVVGGVIQTFCCWLTRLFLFLYQFVADLCPSKVRICAIFKSEGRVAVSRIIHKSQDFLVVHKGCDVFTNNDVEGKPSVHKQVAKLFPELRNERLQHSFYFPHRLDYVTSGLLCLALNKRACAAASYSFQNGTALKFYLALLRGHLSKNLIDVRLPIGEDCSEKAFHKMCTGRNEHCTFARSARTCILVLKRGVFSRYPATKVLIRPTSGRRHQIRVHCSFLGHTIVGDYTYSNRNDTDAERTYLHSYRLALPNSVESLDLTTKDPFADSELGSKWSCVETVNTVNRETMLKLMHAENCDTLIS